MLPARGIAEPMTRLLPICLALMLGACALPAPYVYHANEFDRSAVGFGKDPTDISEVTICYASRNTSPADIVALARQECGRFGKVPVFDHQTYTLCPLTTPNAAVYACVAPESADGQVVF